MSYQTFKLICFGWILCGVIAFIILQFKNAPYGKFKDNSLGKGMDNRTGWIMMESVALLSFLYYSFSSDKIYSITEWVFISLFVLHYINRSFIFPFRTKTTGKQIPITIVVLGLFHNWVNGFLLGYYFSHFGNYNSSWLLSIYFIVGIIVFVTGFFINQQSDHILLKLRKPGETGYKIPHGGMFRFVSSPNLLGEIIEWVGYAIMTWSLPAFCFAFFTSCNLIPRALATQKWYRKKFEEYPNNRKAIIPFIV